MIPFYGDGSAGVVAPVWRQPDMRGLLMMPQGGMVHAMVCENMCEKTPLERGVSCFYPILKTAYG